MQCQATTIGFLASLAGTAIAYFVPGELAASSADLSVDDPVAWNHSQPAFTAMIPTQPTYFDLVTIMISASVLTVYLASMLLSALIFALVYLCNRCQLDPDNVAIPLAASVGDFVTLCLYVASCAGLFEQLHSADPVRRRCWLYVVWTMLAVALLLLLPAMGWLASRCRYTARLLCNGWYSILAGMGLQTLGGLIMEHALQLYPLVPLFQPIINGENHRFHCVDTINQSAITGISRLTCEHIRRQESEATWWRSSARACPPTCTRTLASGRCRSASAGCSAVRWVCSTAGGRPTRGWRGCWCCSPS